MKKIALYLMDAALVSAVLFFYYVRAFYGRGRLPMSTQMAHWRDVCFVLALIAMFVIPFRAVKSYPAIYKFVTFDANGERRKTISIPLVAMIASIIGAVVIIRIFVVATQ
ncbi:hypothetical protein F3J14_16410 [Burkholderia sp. Tr-862]|uniref:hypothetical protein n=1 Tax=Burkholderia sp. Tr-862 TaxID=2608331 RepID=UPI00141A5EF5|nr:hypothetical protein [Burkholderia sp. Tr-862]NIF42438.1 hypothetical protein [Burkholderia sp. Tr-862]